ncbi:MAG TPA: hypothetical protein VII51_05505 [Gaiellaceae bacterium]
MRRFFMLFAICALSLPALALADGSPHGKTIVGTLSANPSGSITVSSATAALTCSVPQYAITSVAKLPLGGHFRLACRGTGGTLVLVKLEHANTHVKPTTTTPPTTGGDHGGTPTTTTTTPTTTTHTPPPPPPTTTTGGDHHGTTTTTAPPSAPPLPPSHREGHGVVTSLSSTSVLITPDGGGAPFACAITPAPDSTAAAAKLTVGAHVGIVCRLDGTHYVLSGATPIT